MCLEQGRWIKPEEFPNEHADWEIQSRTNWAFDPNIRNHDVDYPINVEESPIDPLMFNAVGGSTIHWTAHTPRFHPSDFRVKTLDGVADDWPLSYDELEPYYDAYDALMGCSASTATRLTHRAKNARCRRSLSDRMANVWREPLTASVGTGGRPTAISIPSRTADAKRATTAATPVLVVHGAPKARPTSPSGRKPSPAAWSCAPTPESSASKPMPTAKPPARATTTRTARRTSSPPNAVVLAMNGIGSPRIMLNSTSDAYPDGLCNSSGLLGKNLMFHPYAMVSGLFDDGLQTYKGPLANMILCQEFYETDPSKDFVRGYTYQVARSSGPISTACGYMFGRVPWGADHHAEFQRRFGDVTVLGVIGEDLPEEQNRVELDPKLIDSNGIPSPKVFYTLSDNSRKQLDDAIRNAETALHEAGAVGVLATSLLKGAGWHLMGTARMGEDPKSSVVDRWGQAHDADNIFVVDGSVFVTCAAVNPTPTIGALALRTADYIDRERADLKS